MSLSKPAPGSQLGFSLLEVLVALVIFATAYTVIMQVVGGSARNVDVATHYRQAVVIAESHLAKVRADNWNENIDSYWQGDPEYFVAVNSRPYISAYAIPGSGSLQTREITVDVSWSDAPAQQNSISISTLKLENRRP